jgi:hypothetical protein
VCSANDVFLVGILPYFMIIGMCERIVSLPHSAEGGSKSALDQWKTPVKLKKDGRCSWMAPGVVKTSCKLNVRYFPFDEQVS